MLSTRQLSTLPDIDCLRRRMQRMSALDAVLSTKFGESQFEFHPEWADDEQVGAFKSGSGNRLFAHFTSSGCVIVGFAHESAMSAFRTSPPKLWPGLLSSVPEELRASCDEPAFDIASTTFVVWRRAVDNAWYTDTIEYPDDDYGDGSHELLSQLVMSAEEFAEWLSENYEVEIDADIVQRVLSGEPFSNELLSLLNPDIPLKKLRRAVIETGYPVI